MMEYIEINRQLILDVLSTLDKIEVKGYSNLNSMFGVMYTLRNELNKPQKDGDIDVKSE